MAGYARTIGVLTPCCDDDDDDDDDGDDDDVLVRCDLYLKLEGVTIEKSDRATLNSFSFQWCNREA